MGRNLALNIESRGYRVAVWNLEPEWVKDFIDEHPGTAFEGTTTFEAFAAALERPRRIMMMIPAGKPVDATIAEAPAAARAAATWSSTAATRGSRTPGAAKRSCGRPGFISSAAACRAGKKGARHGPSLMPGGPNEAWPIVRDVLEAIAAKTEAGPCVTHVGPDGAGHFVKMVHNGIEYGDMQLIAESWDVMRRGLGHDGAADRRRVRRLERRPARVVPVELSAQVCRTIDPETGQPLVDVVLDKAGPEGHRALDVAGRARSGRRDPDHCRGDRRPRAVEPEGRARRGGAASCRALRRRTSTAPRIRSRWSTTCTTRCTPRASAPTRRAWRSSAPAPIATSGTWTWRRSGASGRAAASSAHACSIRSVRRSATQPSLVNLLLDPALGDAVEAAQAGWRRTIARGRSRGIAAWRARGSAQLLRLATAPPRLPQNLTQAQRDAFGAHTYERIDRPGAVHSEW